MNNNYYGIWVRLPDDSTLFYDPHSEKLVAPTTVYMPSEFFFLRDDAFYHASIVEHLVDHNCSLHEAELHLSEIRPQDPDYEALYAFFHPPLYPGGPPEG